MQHKFYGNQPRIVAVCECGVVLLYPSRGGSGCAEAGKKVDINQTMNGGERESVRGGQQQTSFLEGCFYQFRQRVPILQQGVKITREPDTTLHSACSEHSRLGTRFGSGSPSIILRWVLSCGGHTALLVSLSPIHLFEIQDDDGTWGCVFFLCSHASSGL